MTDRIEQIRGRLSQASPTPWTVSNSGMGILDSDEEWVAYAEGDPEDAQVKYNVNFIIAAPADIEYLLEELEQANAELDSLRSYE